jgi:hypothetical protein
MTDEPNNPQPHPVRVNLAALTPRQRRYLWHRTNGVTPAEMHRLLFPEVTARAISVELSRAVKQAGFASLADLLAARRAELVKPAAK